MFPQPSAPPSNPGSPHESEHSLAAIVHAAGEGIVTFDAQGTIESFNPAAQRMFGYEAQEIVGQNVTSLLPKSPDKDFVEGVRRYLAEVTGDTLGGLREMMGQRKDGSLCAMEVILTKVSVPRRLFIAMFHDVSERKALEREILEIDADERRRIGQELHDTIAQELLGLGMLSQTLAEDLKDHALPQSEKAFAIVQYLKRVQEQVRALSHTLVPGEIEATELRTALAQLHTAIREVHKKECVFTCPDVISAENNVVATHLYRIVHEAVANSLKHSETNRIDISLFYDDDQLVLQVRDYGIGMRDQVAAAKGIGLRIMHHRASVIGANLTILPAEGSGILVTCMLKNGSRPAARKL